MRYKLILGNLFLGESLFRMKRFLSVEGVLSECGKIGGTYRILTSLAARGN